MRQISWKITNEDAELLKKVVDRAEPLIHDCAYWRHRQDLEMDLTACHANGCPLTFQKMLDAPDFDFMHDVYGIGRYINRTTGKLTEFFVPRCAR